MSLSAQDYPVELRPWYKLFEQAARRHDYSRVFDDWVTMILTQFCMPGMMDDLHKTAMKPYDEKEKKLFNEMFHEIFHVFQDQIEVKGKTYYDLFGHCYEAVASNSKKSHLGQFFTPTGIVEMMVKIAGTGENKTMSDPCCGSGRMLIIWHVNNPGGYTFGCDVDPLCAKMTAVNMALHGCRGEVVCMNTLSLQDFRFAYSINSALPQLGVPTIFPLKEEDCFMSTRAQEPAPVEKHIDKTGQLTFGL